MPLRIEDVIHELFRPVGQLETTVDVLEFGDPSAEVKGIATAFVASSDVIRQAAKAGANLLISHEGIFFSHHNNREAIKNDPVAVEKRKLIEETGMAIFRFHDYWHRYQPDGIMAGLIEQLGWQKYIAEYHPASAIIQIPEASVREIAGHLKSKLGVPYVRVVGDLSMICSRIGLLAGYRGGGLTAIPLFEQENLDLIILGEGPEWETPEYVRDAVQQGKRKAIIVLGHAQSEEPGMNYLAGVLRARYPGLPVYFVAEKPLFQII